MKLEFNGKLVRPKAIASLTSCQPTYFFDLTFTTVSFPFRRFLFFLCLRLNLCHPWAFVFVSHRRSVRSPWRRPCLLSAWRSTAYSCLQTCQVAELSSELHRRLLTLGWWSKLAVSSDNSTVDAALSQVAAERQANHESDCKRVHHLIKCGQNYWFLSTN